MYELILTLLELQASGGVVPVGTPMPCTNCGGQALTAVTAAWGTQGYYAQADVLEQIRNFGLDKWAILAYVLAAFGGLIMAAMGLPYKMYLWFFIGPALFWTLCYDTVDVTGVDWRVGPPVMASGAGSSGSVDLSLIHI